MSVVVRPLISELNSCRTIGIGVMGCGDIAVRRFLPSVVASEKVRLVAVASRDEHTASDVARQFGCAAFRYRELLQSEFIDLVYIALPNHLHEEWTLEALRHGKHVLCEKPLALNAASAGRILAEAEASGLLVCENIMYLHHPQHIRVKEQLAAGRIGSVTGLHCVFTIPMPEPDNFRLDPDCGGGAFHDLNRYPLSAALFFLHGDIDSIVRCDVEWHNGMIISMEAESRTTANEKFTFTIAFGQSYRCFYEISGTDGVLHLERAFTTPPTLEGKLEVYSPENPEIMTMPMNDHFMLTIEYVAALISSGSDFSAEHRRLLSLAHTADRFLQHAQ